MNRFSCILKNEAATLAIGHALACAVKQDGHTGVVAYLNGDLGAGKTTLTRGFVLGMGHIGNVKSPTYTLVEPYDLADWQVYHFDLYRLSDPEELEYMGIRDYFVEKTCCFIEWPEKGRGLLAKPDLTIDISYHDLQRDICVRANSPTGERLLTALTLILREQI
jgi:tRNA threonylcarbamoyladenosine biosynthesis protein TsaE